MTNESEQPTERVQAPAARAARRARRIGGRSIPADAAEEATPRDATAPNANAEDATVGEPARDEPAGAVELDEPAAATEAPAAPAAPTAPAGERADRRIWLPAIVLAVVCLGFLGWCAYESHGVWWAKSSSSVAGERGPVLAAAKSCMAAMNTYDYRKLVQSEATGVACTTGTFTGQYKQAFEKLIKPQAAKVQFTQTAQINNAGVESVSGDGQQWVVLVYGQLSTTNSQTGTKAPTLTPFSARVTMQHVSGKWLVANYQYAPSS